MTTTLVRGVIAAAIDSGVTLKYTGSMSANTGVAPNSRNALADETNVNEGTMTSSPGPTPDEQRGHLQRARARRREEHSLGLQGHRERVHAPVREGTVAGDAVGEERRREVLHLPRRTGRPVEGENGRFGQRHRVTLDSPCRGGRPRPRSTRRDSSACVRRTRGPGAAPATGSRRDRPGPFSRSRTTAACRRGSS